LHVAKPRVSIDLDYLGETVQEELSWSWPGEGCPEKVAKPEALSTLRKLVGGFVVFHRRVAAVRCFVFLAAAVVTVTPSARPLEPDNKAEIGRAPLQIRQRRSIEPAAVPRGAAGPHID
jgi:hypothetical protein